MITPDLQDPYHKILTSASLADNHMANISIYEKASVSLSGSTIASSLGRR